MCPSCGHPLSQDPEFQAARRPRRTAGALGAALLLVLGLAALVKPPGPSAGPPGRVTTAPAPPTRPVKVAASDPPATATVGFPDPSRIAACLSPLGFATGELQKVPLGLWQAVSPKRLFRGEHGDINLFVSGPSSSIASVVELEANSHAADWKIARAELLRALPVLLKHLQLPASAELSQAIEADTGERPNDAVLLIGRVKVRYSTRPIGDLRSARVALTRR